jgi:hypothetical protein
MLGKSSSGRTATESAERVDLRGALLCDRPADFTVMHVAE